MQKDFQILVSHIGAELKSIQREGREYLWNADKSYWGRTAPILFPIVGRLTNDTLRIDGKSYTMKQHGFVRDAEFVPHHTRASLLDSFIRFEPNEAPLVYSMAQDCIPSCYPYDFDLEACYNMTDDEVIFTWTVRNKGDKPMNFQIGAHPAFDLPDYNDADAVHGYIQFYDNQGFIVKPVAKSYLVDGLRHSYEFPKQVTDKNGVLPIKNDTFVNDAILIEDSQVASATLFDKHGHKVLSVVCPQAEAFGIWAPNKPGCPFVCIEPWCGIADRSDFDGNISERELNHQLKPGETYLFIYSVQIR